MNTELQMNDNEEGQPQEGADVPAGTESEELSTEQLEELTKPDEVPVDVPVVQVTMGIGQYVRYMVLNSKKTNSEILELVLLKFPGSKTTPACIAWYKTDMRKKGLLPAADKAQSGGRKVIEFTQEELDAMTK